MKSNAYKRPALYAGFAWALALLFSTPQFALFAKSDGDCVGTYTSPYQVGYQQFIPSGSYGVYTLQYALYVVVFNSVVWLLPSALAGYLYYRVCKAVWQSTSFGSNFQSNGYVVLLTFYKFQANIDGFRKPGHVAAASAGMQVHHKGGAILHH